VASIKYKEIDMSKSIHFPKETDLKGVYLAVQLRLNTTGQSNKRPFCGAGCEIHPRPPYWKKKCPRPTRELFMDASKSMKTAKV
jgi:hypothetical protein